MRTDSERPSRAFWVSPNRMANVLVTSRAVSGFFSWTDTWYPVGDSTTSTFGREIAVSLKLPFNEKAIVCRADFDFFDVANCGAAGEY